MPRVSVITISYNNAKGLQRTIESVVNQDYIDYEYIVIDGGSSDGSRDIIKSFSHKIKYWISEPDRGIYHAMNKGIAVAKGEFLHFLNSGDTYATSSILGKIFSNDYKVPLLRTVQICQYKDGHREKWENLGDRNITLYDMYVNTMLHQATFIKRDLFIKYGLYDEGLKIVADWKFFFKTILNGEKTIFLNIESIVFEMEGLSTNSVNGHLHFQERQLVLDELMPSNIIADYERLKKLEKDAHIPEFIKSNKIIFFFFRLTKIFFKILRDK